MPNKLTTEEFVEKSKKVHGEKFNYSLVNYINKRTKVKIICKNHGIFEQLPSNHLIGRGCAKCSGKGLTIKEFIERCQKIHKNTYDYSLVDDTRSFAKIKIICKNHGEFEQSTNNHLAGAGCHKCFLENRIPTNECFINKARKIHGDKYDYSKVQYENSKKNVKIICHEHGMFGQTPNTHLRKNGCPKCGYISVSKKAISNSHSFSLSSWKNIISKNKNSKPKLYIIKCFNENETFIKIGITINDTKFRFSGKKLMPYNYNILLEICDSAEPIFKNEKLAHKNFKNIKYTPKIKFPGIGECYNAENEKEIIKYCKSIF